MTAIARSDKYLSVAAAGARSVARLAVGVALVRIAGAEALGQYALLVAAEVVLQTAAACLATAPLQTLGPRSRSDLLGYAAARLALVLLPAALLGAALVPAAERWGIPPLAAVGFGLSALLGSWAQLHQGWQRTRFRSGSVLTCELAVGAASLLALAAPIGDPLTRLGWTLAAAHAASGAWLRRRAGPQRPRLAPAERREFRELGWAMFLGSLAYSATARVHPFLLGELAGLEAVALCAAALGLSGPLRMAGGAIDGVLRPRLALLAGGDRARRRRRVFAAAQGLKLAAACAALAGALLAGEPLARALYGDALPGLGMLLPLALGYAALETLGSGVVVALQTGRGAAGARWATRARVGAGALLLALLPAACREGAGAALASLLGCELVFLGAAALGLTRLSNRAAPAPAGSRIARAHAPQPSTAPRARWAPALRKATA